MFRSGFEPGTFRISDFVAIHHGTCDLSVEGFNMMSLFFARTCMIRINGVKLLKVINEINLF